jgi:hypothetical protein
MLSKEMFGQKDVETAASDAASWRKPVSRNRVFKHQGAARKKSGEWTMAEPNNRSPQDNRTNAEREIDRWIYEGSIRNWDTLKGILDDYECGPAIRGEMPESFSHLEIRKAYEFMQRLFEMRQQQQQLENGRGNQGGQGSPMRSPQLERGQRYGSRAPLPATPVTAPPFVDATANRARVRFEDPLAKLRALLRLSVMRDEIG